jgi:serine/threonine-protein kinase
MTSTLTGRRVGNYDVGPLVGAGGMGEVYRARDSQLKRAVAIKVLLPAVANDAERLARFNREAQVLASLNHPNIAHIHGVEQGPDGPLLVLEFVDGPTLADRIAPGALPVDEAITIAKQIADALEAAHERGVIHRDLKPANIKVDDHGNVKVLDFGLAKALDQGSGIGDQGSGGAANSPTITTPAMTQAGLILGTAAYMSPEQAKGRVVDKRSDVWSFGCVLYEMIAGTRAFEGEDVTDTIAAVVRGEPYWTRLPANTPTQVRLLLKRCLEKDRRTRISDIGVARFLLNENLEADETAHVAATASPRGRALVAAIGLLTGAGLVAGAWVLTPRTAPEVRQVRFQYTPPASQQLLVQGIDHDVAIAPDGSFIVFRGGQSNMMSPRLMIRDLNDPAARELLGTENARYPFLSYDSRWIGFFVGQEMRKVPITGGSPVVLCRIAGAPRGASWGDDDVIVFANAESKELRSVAAAGGEPKVLAIKDQRANELVAQPYVLPGSKTVLFTSFNPVQVGASIDALDLATGSRKTIITAATDASYVTTGHLIYASIRSTADLTEQRGAILRGVRFDPSRLETSGDPVTVTEGVAMGSTGAANYSVSPRGHLVFVPAGAALSAAAMQRTLVWVDRKGRETPVGAPARVYATGRIAPDGTRIALDIRDQTNDIWIWDINRQTLSLLNRDMTQDMSPIWLPDSRTVVWTSTRYGGNPNLYKQSADGSGAPERLTTNQGNQFPSSTTPDGRTIALFGSGGALIDVYTVNLEEAGRPQKPLLNIPTAFEFGAEISPDGKWVAYHANDSGEFQVYVRPFPNVSDGRWQISPRGGSRAAWARSGRELFYLDGDGLLTVVPVQSQAAAFSVGAPTKLLTTKYHLGATVLGLDLRAYDVSPDGQRFLMIKEADGAAAAMRSASMIVALNWSEELKQRLPIP